MALLKSMNMRPYDGKGDIEAWLHKAKQALGICASAGMTQTEMIMWLSSHLSGDAETWFTYASRCDSPCTKSASALLSKLREQFIDPTISDTARDKLNDLRQTGSVSSYVRAFRSLVLKIEPPILTQEFVDRFVRGLAPPIQREVKMHMLIQPGFKDDGDGLVVLALRMEKAIAYVTPDSRSRSGSGSGGSNRFRHHHNKSAGSSNGQRNGGGGGGHVVNAMPTPVGTPATPLPSSTPDSDDVYKHKSSGKRYMKKNDAGESLCFVCLHYGHMKADCPNRTRAPTNKGKR
jgi:hypothetical protein